MRSFLVTLIVVFITGCARHDSHVRLQPETPQQLVARCVIRNAEEDPALYEALIPRGLESLPELRKLYLSDDAELRDRAVDAMVVLSLNSTDVVVGGLQSDDPNVRNTALGLSHKQIDDPEMRSLWISTFLDLWRESHLEFDKRNL